MHLIRNAIVCNGQRIVRHELDDGAGGDCRQGAIGPARLAVVPWMGLSVSETQVAAANGDHCREVAGKLRELARTTRLPGIRRELADLARRYDRRGDHFDRRSRQQIF